MIQLSCYNDRGDNGRNNPNNQGDDLRIFQFAFVEGRPHQYREVPTRHVPIHALYTVIEYVIMDQAPCAAENMRACNATMTPIILLTTTLQ